MKEVVRRYWKSWTDFWFEADAYRQMRIFRVLLGTLLLGLYSVRSFDLEFYYSDLGIASASTIADLLPMEFRFSVLHWFSGDVALWIIHFLFLGSLLALTIGFIPKLTALVALILHISFLHRNLAIIYGVDFISAFFLLYLCLANYRPVSESSPTRAILGSLVFRLIQIQICIIYAFAGLHKLKGIYWWEGGAIWNILANPQYVRWDFTWISQFPLVLVIANYSTLIWEIYFPALVWVSRLRPYVLGIGALMHIGIAIFMTIPFFGGLMILSYAVFLSDFWAERIGTFASDRLSKIFLKFRTAFSKVPTPCTDE